MAHVKSNFQAHGREQQNQDIFLDEAPIPDALRGVSVLKVRNVYKEASTSALQMYKS